MLLDLDHFKLINDQYGHDAGDKVLATIGKLLMKACRLGDFVARIGGEEFLIILPHCLAEDAVNKGKHIRTAIENSNPGGLKVTASIGIACLSEEHDADFEKLYKVADEAVYHSKKNGRNRVTIITKKKKTGLVKQLNNH